MLALDVVGEGNRDSNLSQALEKYTEAVLILEFFKTGRVSSFDQVSCYQLSYL
jgi:hypothetical protein